MQIKAMNKYQLAAAYAISQKTFAKWLKKVKKKHVDLFKGCDNDRLLTPAQVKAFIEHHGEPES